MPFGKWIKKLEPHAKEELARELIPELRDGDLPYIFDQILAEMGDRGIEIDEHYTHKDHIK